ncbi:hypothetical protein ACFV6F_07475 [Kitasatospora phosalacinea]|uniref:hypothetical protein n=1 Tax=Kitasatospora phosalacinea TaxID=2065 RepID=UPI0036612587
MTGAATGAATADRFALLGGDCVRVSCLLGGRRAGAPGAGRTPGTAGAVRYEACEGEE